MIVLTGNDLRGHHRLIRRACPNPSVTMTKILDELRTDLSIRDAARVAIEKNVGCVIVSLRTSTMYTVVATVRPEVRRTGIGLRLAKEALSLFTNRNVTYHEACMLSVWRGNESADAFWTAVERETLLKLQCGVARERRERWERGDFSIQVAGENET